MKTFVKENEKPLKKFGMFRHFDDSKRFLQENQHLVCEETANYLVIWCINLEMDEVCLISSSLLNVLNNTNVIVFEDICRHTFREAGKVHYSSVCPCEIHIHEND
jgi:hypothetical protein